MAKVLGIGGFFFHCKDIEATREWYARVLGLNIDEMGGTMFSHGEAVEAFGKGAITVWAPFKTDGDYFAPSTENHMINYIVDDLSGMLERVEAAGVAQAKPREDYDYGSFGWVMDPDGRKIELWEPRGAFGED